MGDKFKELIKRLEEENRPEMEEAREWAKKVINNGEIKEGTFYLYHKDEWFAPILDHILKQLDEYSDIDITKICFEYNEFVGEYVFYYDNDYICYGSDIGQVPRKALRREGRRNTDLVADMFFDIKIEKEVTYKPLKVVSMKHRSKKYPTTLTSMGYLDINEKDKKSS